MKKATLDFFNTNTGRAICAIALLIMLWLLRTDLHSQASAKWISDGHGTFGQVFDLGLMFGALFGIGIWLCLPVRNGESKAPVIARCQSVAKSTRHLKGAICVMRGRAIGIDAYIGEQIQRWVNGEIPSKTEKGVSGTYVEVIEPMPGWKIVVGTTAQGKRVPLTSKQN